MAGGSFDSALMLCPEISEVMQARSWLISARASFRGIPLHCGGESGGGAGEGDGAPAPEDAEDFLAKCSCNLLISVSAEILSITDFCGGAVV